MGIGKIGGFIIYVYITRAFELPLLNMSLVSLCLGPHMEFFFCLVVQAIRQ